MGTGTAEAHGGLLAVWSASALAIIASLAWALWEDKSTVRPQLRRDQDDRRRAGVKVGSQGTEKALDNTQRAIDGMRLEATKAQMFAAYLDPDRAKEAIADIERLT